MNYLTNSMHVVQTNQHLSGDNLHKFRVDSPILLFIVKFVYKVKERRTHNLKVNTIVLPMHTIMNKIILQVNTVILSSWLT